MPPGLPLCTVTLTAAASSPAQRHAFEQQRQCHRSRQRQYRLRTQQRDLHRYRRRCDLRSERRLLTATLNGVSQTFTLTRERSGAAHVGGVRTFDHGQQCVEHLHRDLE